MPIQQAAYDRSTIALHWLTAGLVLVLWLIGTFLEDLLPKGRCGRESGRPTSTWASSSPASSSRCWSGGIPEGRQLPVEDPGPLSCARQGDPCRPVPAALRHRRARHRQRLRAWRRPEGTAGIAALGDPEWRRPLTHWHGLAANILMAVALFHAAAASCTTTSGTMASCAASCRVRVPPPRPRDPDDHAPAPRREPPDRPDRLAACRRARRQRRTRLHREPDRRRRRGLGGRHRGDPGRRARPGWWPARCRWRPASTSR